MNALRKIGSEQAVEEILANVERIDLDHALKTIESLGEAAKPPLLKMLQHSGPGWPYAAAVSTALELPEAIGPLQRVAGMRDDTSLIAIRLLAYYGSHAPLDWAVNEVASFERELTRTYLASHGYRQMRLPNYEALLRILYHSGNPAVVKALMPLIEVETAAGCASTGQIETACATALVVALGRPAFDVLSEAATQGAVGADVEVALKRIGALVEQEETQDEREASGHRRASPSLKRLFALEKSPLDEVRRVRRY